ncbi:Uncharacterised protein [Vibrio cholerae]|nr:Uncharacterised protein [Vibrio cholerae]
MSQMCTELIVMCFSWASCTRSSAYHCDSLLR